VIARWKGIVEEIHFGGSIMPLDIIENLDLEKPSFGPSKWPQKLKTAKNSKLPKLSENCLEPVGKGGWPPISIWINFIFRNINKIDEFANHFHNVNMKYAKKIKGFDPNGVFVDHMLEGGFNNSFIHTILSE
jgi:hypothetical protein